MNYQNFKEITENCFDVLKRLQSKKKMICKLEKPDWIYCYEDFHRIFAWAIFSVVNRENLKICIEYAESILQMQKESLHWKLVGRNMLRRFALIQVLLTDKKGTDWQVSKSPQVCHIRLYGEMENTGDLKSSPYWVVGSSPTRATKFSADSNV